jgi:hypothetical protein
VVALVTIVYGVGDQPPSESFALRLAIDRLSRNRQRPDSRDNCRFVHNEFGLPMIYGRAV